MKARIMKIEKHPSQYSGYFYYVFLKDLDTGKSYRTCVSTSNGNYQRWRDVLQVGIVLDNLRVFQNKIIDADSQFNLVNDSTPVQQ
jgi:hypothetical protein